MGKLIDLLLNECYKILPQPVDSMQSHNRIDDDAEK
jgi:hypothetical protein